MNYNLPWCLNDNRYAYVAGSLLNVKTTVFTRLYLGLWCEHSVETNMGVGDQLEQHIPVVKSLCQ